MSPDFLAAVVDTVLPGERGAGGGAALPPGTAAGVKLVGGDPGRADLLARMAARAGGEAAFVEASSASRAALMPAVEREDFAAFRALVLSLLEDYYETPAVLHALGWRGGGAQPQGHIVAQADATTLARLDKVRSRRSIWRRSG
jgi:hypothetical protein